MGYRTENELRNFVFEEAYIDEIRIANGVMRINLENVRITPHNPCNRDIRMMRTNDLMLTIPDAKLTGIVKEGYKSYNANQVLLAEYPDTSIPEHEWSDTLKELSGASIYSLTYSPESGYVICIDAEEGVYDVTVSGGTDIEEWERFLNL